MAASPSTSTLSIRWKDFLNIIIIGHFPGESISCGGQRKRQCQTRQPKVVDGPTKLSDSLLQREHCAGGVQESQAEDGRRQGRSWTPCLQIGERRVNFYEAKYILSVESKAWHLYTAWKNSVGQLVDRSSEHWGWSPLLPLHTASEINLVEAPRISRISADRDLLRKTSDANKTSLAPVENLQSCLVRRRTEKPWCTPVFLYQLQQTIWYWEG